MPVDDSVTALADAIARGRLTLAEVAGMGPAELEAIFAMAADRLDAQRPQEAAEILSGLVTLFPFSAKYWRAYGIALHRMLELTNAKAAYDVALLLAPDDLATRGYRGEVLLYLGEKEESRADLAAAARSSDPLVVRRARDLTRTLDALARWEPEPVAPSPVPEAEPDSPEMRFALEDGRPLPVDDSPLTALDAEAESKTELSREEITRTAVLFAAHAPPPPAEPAELVDVFESADEAHGREEITQALSRRAIAERRSDDAHVATAAMTEGSAQTSITQTAVLPGRRGHQADASGVATAAGATSGATDGAGAAEDTATTAARAPSAGHEAGPTAMADESTLTQGSARREVTAIVRRRLGGRLTAEREG